MSWPLRLAGWALFLLAGVTLLPIVDALPFLTRSHLVFLAIMALAATGLTMIMGLAGQISLGHAAFYGMGGYASAILTVDHGWHPVAALLFGVALAAAVSAVVARLVFRVTEHYLAMATLAFGLIFYFALRHFRSLTGGSTGRGGIDKVALGPLELTTNTRMFLFVWVVLALGVLLARNILHSRTGRALQALWSSPVAASCCGINLVRAKVAVFALGGAYAALAGSLYAHHVTYVSPDEFGLLRSIQFLIVVIVGGLTSVWGGVVGAVALLFLTEFGRDLVPVFVEGATGPYELVIYGLVLVIVLLFFQRGIAGTVSHRWRVRQRSRMLEEADARAGAPAVAASGEAPR